MNIHKETFQSVRPDLATSLGKGAMPSRRPMNRVKSCKSRTDSSAASVGFRLAIRRLELNHTQAEVAGKVNILPKSGPNKGKVRFLSRNALSTYESGRQTPSLYLLRGLAAALGVSPGWLAFGEDSERISNPSRHASSAGQRPKFGVLALSDSLSARAACA